MSAHRIGHLSWSWRVWVWQQLVSQLAVALEYRRGDFQESVDEALVSRSRAVYRHALLTRSCACQLHGLCSGGHSCVDAQRGAAERALRGAFRPRSAPGNAVSELSMRCFTTRAFESVQTSKRTARQEEVLSSACCRCAPFSDRSDRGEPGGARAGGDHEHCARGEVVPAGSASRGPAEPRCEDGRRPVPMGKRAMESDVPRYFAFLIPPTGCAI